MSSPISEPVALTLPAARGGSFLSPGGKGREALSGGRVRVTALVLALSACNSPPATAPRERPAKTNLIPCATGNAPLTTTCTVELAGKLVTVRNPDGGFHRLLVTRDGRGLIAADGAQPAKVTPVDTDTIEVAIANDRYRLPATVARR